MKQTISKNLIRLRGKLRKEIPDLTQDQIDRFNSKVNTEGSCHLWRPGPNNTGYGQISINGKMYLAHRVAYAINKGNCDEMEVCHTCDTPLCVNHEHLFLGTHAENMRDMFRKNRRKTRMGAELHSAKLNDEAVRYIRLAKGTLTIATLALKYGVNQSTIERAMNRKYWTHVK